MSCGVGHRHGSDVAVLWLWRRLVAIAPIGPLAWEPPYATGAALKKKKKKKKKRPREKQSTALGPLRFLAEVLWTSCLSRGSLFHGRRLQPLVPEWGYLPDRAKPGMKPGSTRGGQPLPGASLVECCCCDTQSLRRRLIHLPFSFYRWGH